MKLGPLRTPAVGWVGDSLYEAVDEDDLGLEQRRAVLLLDHEQRVHPVRGGVVDDAACLVALL